VVSARLVGVRGLSTAVSRSGIVWCEGVTCSFRSVRNDAGTVSLFCTVVFVVTSTCFDVGRVVGNCTAEFMSYGGEVGIGRCTCRGINIRKKSFIDVYARTCIGTKAGDGCSVGRFVTAICIGTCTSTGSCFVATPAGCGGTSTVVLPLTGSSGVRVVVCICCGVGI
jgi:hypothetical protein